MDYCTGIVIYLFLIAKMYSLKNLVDSVQLKLKITSCIYSDFQKKFRDGQINKNPRQNAVNIL